MLGAAARFIALSQFSDLKSNDKETCWVPKRKKPATAEQVCMVVRAYNDPEPFTQVAISLETRSTHTF